MKKIIRISLFIACLFIFPFSILAAENEASIGSNNYSTIVEAINAVTDTQEITLLKNINTTITIPSNKKVTINLNGFQYNSALSTNIKNDGNLILKNGSILPGASSYAIENNGTLSLNDIKCENVPSTGRCLRNSGTATVTSGSYASTEYGNLFINNESGILTFNSGEYKSNGAIYINKGSLTINNGNFNILSNINANENNGKNIINNGVFTSKDNYFISNANGDLTINGGKFEGKGIAENNDMDGWLADSTSRKSNIIVNNGTFNTTSTAFSNGLTINSTIKLNGGKINMSGSDRVIAENSKGNLIQIIKTNIDAPNSNGFHLDYLSTFIIGNDDKTVKKDEPIINIPKGEFLMGGSGGKIKFYDGTIKLNKKMDSIYYSIETPLNYYVKYDNNSDGTITAYLNGKGNSIFNAIDNKITNPKTSDRNIYIILLGIIMFISVVIVTYKKIKKLNKSI